MLYFYTMKRTKEAQLIKKLEDKVKKAIYEYELIKDGDCILLALSGGKDSLALLELLGMRSRIFHPKFKLVVAHIVMTNVPYASDLDYLKSMASTYDLPFIVHETAFDATTDTRKTPCFLCSWTRRKALFEIAKAHGCNKIALGHHQDDILETLLMNLTHQGSFGTMPPRLVMNRFDMEIIRPLCLIAEKDILTLAEMHTYKKQQHICPYEKTSLRTNVKGLLAQLEAQNPEVRYSLWNSMTNIQTDYLPKKRKD